MISIQDIGDFDYQDSLIIATVDSLKYEIKIITEPEDADIYYSTPNRDFDKQQSEWIHIDSTIYEIQFYADKQGFNKSSIKGIEIDSYHNNLIMTVDLYPNPFDSIINIEINSKTRGKLHYQVFDLTGKLFQSDDYFISDDSFKKSTDLSDLEYGVYILHIEYGNTTLTKKIMRQ
ncbi:MAG: T9SS type A sorting domain-containing protein [Reichenbachiella sp.]